MADVFLSYAKEDRALAERVVLGLKKRGFTVWWDNQIGPSKLWDRNIEHEIAEARSVVVLWTPASINKQWVREEATFAKDNGNKLIQVKCGAVAPPLGFTLLQFVELLNWPAADPHPGWERLISWVGEAAGTAPEVRKTLNRFRTHFMNENGYDLDDCPAIEIHTPINEMLDDYANNEEFGRLAWKFCFDCGAYTPPMGDEEDSFTDELECLYEVHGPMLTVGHLVELVRERTPAEKERMQADGDPVLDEQLEAILDELAKKDSPL